MSEPRRRVLVELCIASADDAATAQASGVDRVELNSALGLGGLTPSLGCLIESRAAARIPIIAMIRPRPGGFAYSASDYRVMKRDAALCLENGADGLAFGFLNSDGSIDRDRCADFRADLPEGMEMVFHRAFDVTPDPIRALETLIGLGIKRVLTSGQEESAYAGASLIAKLIRRSAGRIEILPGGGINRFTVRDVIERTGCDQIHGSFQALVADTSTALRPAISFGATYKPPEDRHGATSPERLSELFSILGSR